MPEINRNIGLYYWWSHWTLDRGFIRFHGQKKSLNQAEAEVVPSSSLVEVGAEVEAGVEVGADVEVGVEIEVGVYTRCC